VTGAGLIDSPAGAYTPNPSLKGKANFNFVVRYQQGAIAPSGQTQFRLNAANLDFSSTSYQWLAVVGPKAQFKGTGTINGSGNYDFFVTIHDGDVNNSGKDKFRIKIWDKGTGNVIYDNQIGAADDADATAEITGGSITVHK